MNFIIEQYEGKGEARSKVKTIWVSGLDTVQTKTGNIKINPQNKANLATLKGAIEKFPSFAGSIFNTHLGVYLRAKLPNGWKGTFIQALQAAETASKVIVRSPEFQKHQALLVLADNNIDKAFESSKALGMKFLKKDFEAVAQGNDPWAPEPDENDQE